MKLMNICAVIALSSLFSVACFGVLLDQSLSRPCKSKKTGEIKYAHGALTETDVDLCRKFGEEFVPGLPTMVN